MTLSRFRHYALSGLVVAALLAGCSHGTASKSDGAPAQATVGLAAPSWSEATLGGSILSLASLRGKPVYLNFFASWCHGCNEEASAIETTHNKFAAQGLRVVGVDVAENVRMAEVFRSAHHLSYPIVIDDGTLQHQYDIGALPVQVFIDRNGIVQKVIRGQVSQATMTSNVEPLLQ
ncbi:MAG: TlpA family protein disulfide reductase [Candidatus Eremiobacteraeota bacterium]|nr:TlpA family protein disulfide reductase [Candidatus Eremiobacteraeota bacterium]